MQLSVIVCLAITHPPAGGQDGVELGTERSPDTLEELGRQELVVVRVDQLQVLVAALYLDTVREVVHLVYLAVTCFLPSPSSCRAVMLMRRESCLKITR